MQTFKLGSDFRTIFFHFQPTNTVYEPKLLKDIITEQLILIAIDNIMLQNI